MYKEADYSLFRFAVTRHPILFCIIHGLVVVFTVVLPFTDQFHWALIPMSVIVEVGYWIGTNEHRNRLRKMNEKGPNNKHRSDVLEEADPVRWKDGRPLMELHIWYAAVEDKSWEDAKRELHWLENDYPEKHEKIEAMHARYLKHPKFDKFRT